LTNSLGLIPYGGNEVVLETYNVLVFDSDLYRFRNKVGRYWTSNDWRAVKPGNTDSELIHISPHAPIIPRILVGLNKIDICHHKTVRVRADVDEITCTQFTTRIGTWSDCKLFNSAASSLQLAAADPDFQHGDAMYNGEQTTTIPFNWRFDRPPLVYVGIRGFEVSGDRRINVSASDVSRTGFNLNVDTWGNTQSLVCWVSALSGKEGAGLINTHHR
jgi:H-type lectin domain